MKIRIFSLVLAMLTALFAFASCGETVNEECVHTFSDAWETDANNHWHAATCEHGEMKDALAAHSDADEDGKCDTCAYEMGHTHTFASAWSFDETSHWKAATCTHTTEKGELGLHKDDNNDGICDACENHVHVLDVAGFCTGCNKQVKPVDETDIAAVIATATRRNHNIISGVINDYRISRWNDASLNLEVEQAVEFYIGTNGTYRKWTYDEVDFDGVKTGKTEILEQWLKIAGTEVTGIDAISVDGVYKFAQPGSFSADDLKGYYYTVSTLADGYCAEELLFNLYNAYIENRTDETGDAVVVHDAENNKYDLEFKIYVINESNVTNASGAESVVYNVNYYEVEISFTYADDYTLTSLSVSCDVWTNDAGANEPIDFTYDPVNGVEWKDDAIADNYTISVTHDHDDDGTRGEIELNDGSEFAPDSFEIYSDEACTVVVSDLNIDIADTLTQLYITVSEGKFLSFIKNDFVVTITDKDGNSTTGLLAPIVDNTIQILPSAEGEYVVTISAIGITKTINVNVTAPELKGEYSFTVEVVDSYSWSSDWSEDGVCYEFVVTETGTYTFYLPTNFGIWVKSSANPEVDPFDGMHYDRDAEHTYTKVLRAGQTLRFYFAAVTKGEYTIGYDIQ